MIKLNRRQQIYIEIATIVLFLVLVIPIANNGTLLNLVFSKSTYLIAWIHFVVFVFAVYSFLRLSKGLKQTNSAWRFFLYLVVFIWFTSDAKDVVGDKIMNLRSGLKAIELQLDNSEISYQKDTLGMVHINGDISFRNYSSEPVAFKGILHGENFLLNYNDSIADISIPGTDLLDGRIEIPPKSTYTYQIECSRELEINNLKYSKYNGVINTIRRFTIYSGEEKMIFEY